MPEPRFYRQLMAAAGLCSFNVTEGESDLQIAAESDLTAEARRALRYYRQQLTEQIRRQPAFRHSLVPVEPLPDSPALIQTMCQAAVAAKVGPMAAVAGALAQYVGLSLLKKSRELIIENGGDLFVVTNTERKVLIYAGASPFSNRVALLIPGDGRPWGICTSSGTVGHALSFGRTDAAVVVARDAALADAAATAVGNVVTRAEEIEKGLERGKSIPGVEGVLIIVGDKMGAYGNINLTRPGKEG